MEPLLTPESMMIQVLQLSRSRINRFWQRTDLCDKNGEEVKPATYYRTMKKCEELGYIIKVRSYSHKNKYGPDAPNLCAKYNIRIEAFWDKIKDEMMPLYESLNIKTPDPLTDLDITDNKKIAKKIDPPKNAHKFKVPYGRIYRVNKRLNDKMFRLRWATRVSYKRRFGAYISGRMNSPLCFITTKARKEYFASRYPNINQYDIRSTIPAIVKLLNKKVWDEDLNLKKRILYNAQLLLPVDSLLLTEKQIKAFSFRVFFSKSKSQAWRDYKYTFQKKHLTTGVLTKDQFGAIYDACIAECGRNPLGPSLFHVESLIELSVIEKILANGGNFYGSVYDCFFSDQPDSVIKKYITESALEVGKSFQ